jgi:Flp pilus assembly pilin Flp
VGEVSGAEHFLGLLARFFAEEKAKKGQGLVEYALILVLVAIVVVAIVTLVGS